MEFPYTFEPLGPLLRLCVTPQHKFGTDAFLLSHFAAPRRRDLVCDLGTGCGIVAVLWHRDMEHAPRESYCVDLQPQAIAQLEITLRENPALADRIHPLQADLKNLPPQLVPGRFDLVTCNPPYKRDGAGILSETDSDRLARHETACSLDDVCKAAARLLRFGGRFCLCQRPERLADVMEAMRQNKLEPKRLRMVQQQGNTAPWLFLVEGKKGSAPFMQVEAPLIIETQPGILTEELLEIYQKERRN